jgi:predicted PurR-regulated permease PerM
MLYDWDRMVARVDSWLPRDHADEIRKIARDIDDVIAAFVRGQGLVSLTLAFVYAAGLVLIGLNFGLLIGLAAGLLSFIPFVGATVGFVVSLAVAIVQFWPDWIWILATVAVFVVGQSLENYVLQPRLIGDNVGLHPVWVMFALFAFGYLFGFVGVMIAIPAAAAVGVLVRYALARYLESPIYRGDG